MMVPSHSLYVDDIMIIRKGNSSFIAALQILFDSHAACSGQSINPSKSVIFSSSMTSQRQNRIANMLGFSICRLPLLGVPYLSVKLERVLVLVPLSFCTLFFFHQCISRVAL